MQLLKHKTEKFFFCNDLFDWMVFINICSSKQTSMFNFKERINVSWRGERSVINLEFPTMTLQSITTYECVFNL